MAKTKAENKEGEVVQMRGMETMKDVMDYRARLKQSIDILKLEHEESRLLYELAQYKIQYNNLVAALSGSKTKDEDTSTDTEG